MLSPFRNAINAFYKKMTDIYSTLFLPLTQIRRHTNQCTNKLKKILYILFWLNSCLSKRQVSYIHHFPQVTKYNHNISSCFYYTQFHNHNPFHHICILLLKGWILSETNGLQQYVLINSFLHRRHQNISFTNV